MTRKVLFLMRFFVSASRFRFRLANLASFMTKALARAFVQTRRSSVPTISRGMKKFAIAFVLEVKSAVKSLFSILMSADVFALKRLTAKKATSLTKKRAAVLVNQVKNATMVSCLTTCSACALKTEHRIAEKDLFMIQKRVNAFALIHRIANPQQCLMTLFVDVFARKISIAEKVF